MTGHGGAPVAVIGAGPAGLMAADVLTHGGARVTVYDRMPSAGRKLLMAGRGGLNLTHGEPLDQFLVRYGAARDWLSPAIDALTPDQLRAFSASLGEDTFVGSSGRVFPKAFKASPLLRAWLRRLSDAGVAFRFRQRWTGWDTGGRLTFENETPVTAEAIVLALGGASWPRLGSDGHWQDVLRGRDVAVSPLRPANCGFVTSWSGDMRARFAGTPLKTVALTFDGRTVRGDVMITASGIEGGPVYALSAALRDSVLANGSAALMLALRPDREVRDLAQRLAAPRGKQSVSTHLRKATGLSPAAIAVLHETAAASGRKLAEFSASELAALVNAVPVRLVAPAPIDRAISTAGGIMRDEVDDAFMLRRLPGVFVAGEMLDWEAPTGGYLLQACFATGAAAGRGALAWVRQ